MIINKMLSKLKIRNSRTSKDITISEAKQIIATNKNVILLDVRSIQEYKEYHIDGAICIPHYEILSRIEKEIQNKNAIIIVYCQSGIRSKKTIQIMAKKGYQNIYHIKNGLDG